FAGLSYAMVGQFGVKKASGTVSRSLAGSVTHNKEKIGRLGIFEHGLQPENLPIETKFGDARRGQMGRGAKDGWNVEHFGRVVRDPARVHAVGGIRRVPAQSMEADAGGSLQILDAQGELFVAMNHDDGERANRQLRGFVGIVSEQVLLLRGLTIDQEIFG